MGIPEGQLVTWAKRGSVTQSADTYEAIKQVIESNSASYSNEYLSSFLQGSYGNYTNIYGAESDVDIVLQCNSVYYYSLEDLTEFERRLYEQTHVDAQYSYTDFKNEVKAWLLQQFGEDVNFGTKAIRIKGQGNRREADVLPCVQFRRYMNFNGNINMGYIEGLCFFLPDGTKIINYPKIHKQNCTSKNQGTENQFRRMVRVLKNMRNRMKTEGLISGEIAPSYYLEGLLYNVPNKCFGTSYQHTFVQCYNYLQDANKKRLVCANRQAWLLRAGRPTSWDPDDFNTFFDALADFWNGWN